VTSACPYCVQMESETAKTELKLFNATQRLQWLEHDVLLLKDKAENVTLSRKLTNQDATGIEKIAEEVKKVSLSLWSSLFIFLCFD